MGLCAAAGDNVSKEVNKKGESSIKYSRMMGPFFY